MLDNNTRNINAICKEYESLKFKTYPSLLFFICYDIPVNVKINNKDYLYWTKVSVKKIKRRYADDEQTLIYEILPLMSDDFITDYKAHVEYIKWYRDLLHNKSEHSSIRDQQEFISNSRKLNSLHQKLSAKQFSFIYKQYTGYYGRAYPNVSLDIQVPKEYSLDEINDIKIQVGEPKVKVLKFFSFDSQDEILPLY